MSRPALTAWRADALRVSAFPTPDAVITPDAWWKDLLGAEAEVETLRKGRLVRQEQGEALGGLLRLTVQPGRIDWSLGPKPPPQPPEDFPSVGTFTESLPRLVDLVSRWTPSCPTLGRFAFGVNASMPAASQEEAYGVLDALLPAVEVDPSTTDFQYRVNRPRNSRLNIEGLRVNRLSTWAAMRMEVMALTGGSQPFRAAPTFAVRAELDINTAPDFAGPLPMASLTDLLREFADLAAEILTEGERP
jgi:hypothetical protein